MVVLLAGEEWREPVQVAQPVAEPVSVVRDLPQPVAGRRRIEEYPYRRIVQIGGQGDQVAHDLPRLLYDAVKRRALAFTHFCFHAKSSVVSESSSSSPQPAQ
jgi:hypothetical protein